MNNIAVMKRISNKRRRVEVLPVRQSLIQAVNARDIVNIKYLIDNKIAHIELPDRRGWTSIHHAGYVGDLEILKLLLGNSQRTCRERLALKNWEDETPLIVACQSKQINPDVIYHMLANGAEVDAQNIYDQTALCFACTKLRNLKVIKMLIDMGGNPMAPALHGSPISRAIQYNLESETIQYLLQRYTPSFMDDRRLLNSALKSKHLPLIIDNIKPDWFALLSLLDPDYEKSLPLCCIFLETMDKPEIFYEVYSLPYMVDESSFERLFHCVPSDKLNFKLLNTIFSNSNNFKTHLDIILKRLYHEEVYIVLPQVPTELSREMRVFVSRYIFIETSVFPTLMEMCRKVVVFDLFAKHKNIRTVQKSIKSTKLPPSIKGYLIRLFNPKY